MAIGQVVIQLPRPKSLGLVHSATKIKEEIWHKNKILCNKHLSFIVSSTYSNWHHIQKSKDDSGNDTCIAFSQMSLKTPEMYIIKSVNYVSLDIFGK